jgi:hypothetical protein
MRAARVEAASWGLIYAGLLTAILGWFVMPRSTALGLGFMLGGAVCTVIGVALIAVRARMRDPSQEQDR